MPVNWMGSKLKFVIQCFIYRFLALSLCFPWQSFINVFITLDMVEHFYNMYSNDPTSLRPYLTPLLISYREKNKWSNELVIHSRLFQSRPSSKKASCEKDPTGFHHPRKQHHFISLCMLAVRGVFSGVGVYEFRGWANPPSCCELIKLSISCALQAGLIHCLLGIDSIKVCMWLGFWFVDMISHEHCQI